MQTPQSITLDGPVVRLEPLAMAHVADLADARGDAAHYEWMGATPVGVDMSDYVADAMAGVARGEFVAWATVVVDEGRAVGMTRFGDIVPEHARVEIGWTWIGPSWRAGACNPSAKLLQLQYAFDELGARRVGLMTDANNIRSQRAIAGLGATQEGVLRKHRLRPDGSSRDTVSFSITDDDWPRVRERLQRVIAERLAR